MWTAFTQLCTHVNVIVPISASAVYTGHISSVCSCMQLPTHVHSAIVNAAYETSAPVETSRGLQGTIPSKRAHTSMSSGLVDAALQQHSLDYFPCLACSDVLISHKLLTRPQLLTQRVDPPRLVHVELPMWWPLKCTGNSRLTP